MAVTAIASAPMAATTSSGESFLHALNTAPQAFLQPTSALHAASLAFLKDVLDPVARDVSAAQAQRLQALRQSDKLQRRKRKRGDRDVENEEEDVRRNMLKLQGVHTEGFSTAQVWEQVRRVVDAAKSEAQRELEGFEMQVAEIESEEDEEEGDEEEEEDFGVEGVDYEVEGVDDGEEMYNSEEDEEDGEDEDEDEIDEMAVFEDFDDEDEDEEMDGMDESIEDAPAEEYVADKFGLNDGFFSIDDFNRQSEFLEQRDTQGDNDGAASDEEDVDWDADPVFATGGRDADQDGDVDGMTGMRKTQGQDEDDDDEDGPTFGDPDALSESDGDINDGDLDPVGSLGNTNDIMYKDFFAPPAQKKSKKKKAREVANLPNSSKSTAQTEDQDGDVERTMAAVHRDLFEESDEDEPETTDQPEALDPSDPRSRRSAHERRKLALAEEIRKLEAANVAKRAWTLSGEARAADRPMNSLLEEDLDFERAGKPIPVITAEVSDSIEELIKRRILANDFQDLIRRRPNDLATGSSKRGRVDILSDAPSKKGLAEEYEEEHLRRTDPNFVDVTDAKLAQEQAAIESLWKEVSSQLDSLSSWHFRPKAPAPTLDIRVDAPAVAMEDARPSAAGADIAGASQLAPQEIYKGGEATRGVRGEVVGKSGLPAGREELSREEKKSRRRRAKERGGKSGADGAGADSKNPAKAAKQKKNVAMFDNLKRGDVKVIGKKGEVRDVEGRKAKVQGSAANGTQGAAQWKL